MYQRLVRDQAVPNFCDGLDVEAPAAHSCRHLPQAGDRTIYGILADNPTAPAILAKLVACDDASITTGERHQHLHYAGFQRLP